MAKQMTEDELKKRLTPEQYHIVHDKGTEAPFTGKYFNHNKKGMYTCAVCGAQLFSSDTKFESKAPGLMGWPSFSDIANNDAVKLNEDNSFGMKRIEVTCTNCGSHLGHLFENVPGEEHAKHFCINSACLGFQPKETTAKKAK